MALVLKLYSTARVGLLQPKNNKTLCGQCFQRFAKSKFSTSSLQGFKSKSPILSKKTKSFFSVFRQSVTQTTNSELKGQKLIGYWMLGCAGMCFGAVVLGGVTRLTESGLSMTDWHLIKDMTYPKTEKDWEEQFDKYKQFPEYKYVASEKEMTLSDFKFIYFMEWAHRMWGRTTGMVFLVPLLVFMQRKMIPKSLAPRLVGISALLAFQGFLGWYMVKSGLEEKPGPNDIPRVSQYRLAAHLGSAFVLYTLFLWQGLNQFFAPVQLPNVKGIRGIRMFAHTVKGMVFLTAISGAFVAGLDAGLTYNSYPMMADRWIPSDLWSLSPKWKNIFENPTTVQFNHRHLAEFTVCLIATFWAASRKVPLHRRAMLAINSLLAMGILQASLGITTLLTYVPTHIAATHQSGSLVLLSIAVWLTHELRRLPK